MQYVVLIAGIVILVASVAAWANTRIIMEDLALIKKSLQLDGEMEYEEYRDNPGAGK